MHTARLFVVAAVVPGALVPGALAQCDPAWVPGPGSNALGNGYAEPVCAWDDGSGEALYVGGSFTSIGGFGYRGIARWNPGTGQWSRPGTGLSFGNTNGFVTSILPFDTGAGTLLVVGGFFASAGGQAGTQSLAAWDGGAWRSLGAGFVAPEAVWSLEVGDLGDGEKLYLAGGFLQIAGQPCSGVAAWDGGAFTVVGDGLGMAGFSPFVNETVIWDDGSGVALYAVGRFSEIDGVSAPLAARYRPGVGWERFGGGLTAQNSTTTLDGACVFDDGDGGAIYIAGSPFRPAGGGSFSSVYKWDGVAWSVVGQNVGGRVTDLRVWDDGTGPALYLSGTATPDINYLARLEGGSWEMYLGGAGGPAIPPGNFPSVFGLAEYRGDLVVCGSFTETGDGQIVEGIAVVETCLSDCVADFNGDGVVNTQDFIAYLGAWAAGDPAADTDGNGVIDTRDFIGYLGLWAAGC
jgi:hypothetical protein